MGRLIGLWIGGHGWVYRQGDVNRPVNNPLSTTGEMSMGLLTGNVYGPINGEMSMGLSRGKCQ